MKLRSLRYYLREAFISLFRNRLMTLASIITAASCVFILIFSLGLAMNIDYMLSQLEGSLSLTADIDDDLPATDTLALFEVIRNMPNVESVRYISADQALESLREQWEAAGRSHLLDGLEYDNPLPRSFSIALYNIAYQDSVLHELHEFRRQGLLVDIRYDQEIISAIVTISNGIRVVSIVLILFLVVLSSVIIMNTVKLTVNNRRAEITIMKYVGATDWFIRWPFIIEGMLIGLIGALIPISISWAGYQALLQRLHTTLQMLQDLFVFRTGMELFSFIMPIALMVGIGVGVLGSIMSIRRYLRV